MHVLSIPDPFEEHCVSILAGQVDYEGWPWGPDVCPDHQRLRALAFILQGVGLDPDLVLRVGL